MENQINGQREHVRPLTLSYDFPWLLRQKGATARYAIYGGQWRRSDRTLLGRSGPCVSLVDRRLHQGPERIRAFMARMTRIGLAKMTEYTIGIDISKTHLDAFRLEDQAARQFENSARGFQALIKWLGQTPVARSAYCGRRDRRGHLRCRDCCASPPNT